MATWSDNSMRIRPDDQSDTHLPFFVYGTLRPGEHNHARILADVAVTEIPSSLDGATMFAGPGFPYVTDGESTVVGDLIWVAEDDNVDTLGRLDQLEGYRGPESANHYDRVIRTVTTVNGAEIEAWVYLAGERVNKHRLGAAIESGDWLEPAFAGAGR